MHITKSVRTTYTTEQKLTIAPPDFDGSRGLRYWPDMDDEAAKAARPFWDRASSLLRMSAKDPEAPVSLSIQRRDGEVWAVCQIVTTKGS